MKTLLFYIQVFIIMILGFFKLITPDTGIIVITMLWITYFGKQFWDKEN